MKKIWAASYPPGVPMEISPSPYHSIADLFMHAVRSYGPETAIINYGKTTSYNELERLTRELAAFWVEDLKLLPGDRVAIMMPNLCQYVVALYAAFRAGLVVVNVNPLYTARELSYQLNDSGAKAIVILANMAHTLEESLPDCPELQHIIITEVGDIQSPMKGFLMNMVTKYFLTPYLRYHLPMAVPFKKALKLGSRHKHFKNIKVTPADTAFLQYTGGTTGVAKGAILTHANMLANIQQGKAWINTILSQGRELVVTALPLYHIFSLTANCLIFTELGAKNLLITNPRDIKGFVKELKKYPFTIITGVNTLFNALLNNPDFKKLDFSHLKLTMGGGMAVQYSIAEAWKAVTGKPLHEAYGLTETSPAVTINPFNLKDYTGSIGLPLPSTDVKILGEHGEELDISQTGELCIKGPQVMKGYWNKPEETKLVLDAEGWLKTGDIARLDAHGFIYIVDRKKDMILVSGFNVYPNEIEDVIMQNPRVLEAAAVGMPNSTSGQSVKLFIVKKDPSLTAQDVIDFCSKRLTRYKVPKTVEFRDELPKTNVGKILRRELREQKK